MAAPTVTSPTLKRTQATRHHGPVNISPRRGRRGSGVHFDEITSIFPLDRVDSLPDSQHHAGTLRSEPEEEEDQIGAEKCYTYSTLLGRHWVKKFFRVCAVFNLLSLAFSAPLRVCPEMKDGQNVTDTSGEDCNGVFIQFVIIAAADVILALLYTLQLLMRIQYTVFLCFGKNKRAPPIHEPTEWFEADTYSSAPEGDDRNFTRLFILILVTLSLWYSVGIGAYRSVLVKRSEPTMLEWYYYLPLILRSFGAISAMKLFVHLKIPTTALNSLLKNIKNRWKQLFFVAIFYLFFIYIYALIGVQWLGGLTERCFLNQDGKILPAIPLTHCSHVEDNSQQSCFNSSQFDNYQFNNSQFECMGAPDNSTSALNINYRNTVYLGQFRFILDALFAVYEASSWELWSFMEVNAFSGAPRSVGYTAVFYITMVFFLVVFIQQSIFLVVIIESFADLRSDEAVESSSKQQDKPTIVLYEQKGNTNEISFKHIKTQESLTAFKNKLNKYYFHVVEKGFIVLVLVDAVVTATKHTGMSNTLADVLTYWQFVVSILFVVEVIGLFVFHLLAMPMQLLLFVKNYYFWYLIVIAIGGLVGGIPMDFNDPQNPGHWLSIFQSLRLLRALRLVPQMRRFFSSIIGDGVRLLIVVLLVLVFLVWFAVVSMQIFGYLEPEGGCERLGSDNFRDFFHSFQSMFQLLMQEGWSQLFSEIMCKRDVFFIFINLYFIILHLFASLILLNFFVAVILDNLDYDEELKKKKLEEAEKNTQKVQKVPFHLRIFQLCGPKKISVPKISSSDAPNLTEADVRNFYNIGEVTDFPTGFVAEQPPILHPEGNFHRRSSEFTNLELLTDQNSQQSPGGLSAQHRKNLGIQGILNYVKAYRQHSRDKEESRLGQGAQRPPRGGDFLGARGKADASTPLLSEYDIYREQYRLFDTALFCMPPEHRFRRFCKAVLTKQLEEPAARPLKDAEENIAKNALKLCAYFFRYVFSALPYFTWLMLLVFLAALIAQIIEVGDGSVTYIWWMDLFFVVFTVAELILKILANGFFFNPHAAIQSLWDVIDWFIVLSSFAVMVVYLSACDPAHKIEVSYRNIPVWLLVLLFFRALRPLRLISLVPKMRHLIYELLLGWRKFFLAGVLLIFFVFMFASLGVQLFAGEGSPEGFCNDPSMNKTGCVGQFLINIEVSPQELLPLTDIPDTFIYVPRVWYKYRRNFRFDNTFNAFLTLFVVLTLEGWLDVRDLFGTESDVFQNSRFTFFMSIYIHIFVFLGVNFVLQLFVGIVVNNFNEHKPDHSALLTVSQKRWTDLVQRISLTRPIKKPPPPRDNKFRMLLYKVFLSSTYKNISTIFIVVNSLLLWSPWVQELHKPTRVLMSISVAFAGLFFIEVVLKLVAFSPKKYFQSWRNGFDCALSVLGVCYIVAAVIYLSSDEDGGGRDMEFFLIRVTDTALVFTVLKLFTILMKYSVLQNLLYTVGSTLFRSASLMGVLLTILLLYTFLGNLFFRNVRSGEAVDTSFVNFVGFFRAFNVLIRVVTGEDWYTIFRDTMVQEPYCSEEKGTCGNPVIAIFYFVSFFVFVSFIFLNVVIAVLLENFSIFYNEDDTELNHAVVRDYKLNWLYYDKKATGVISSEKIKLFLRMLRLKEFYSYVINENGVKERQKSHSSSDPIILREMAEELRRNRKPQGGHSEGVVTTGGQSLQSQEDKEHNIPFQDVLKMLAYRAEDISQRLVPHELYTREEFENSVQFDVAEQCILKWIKKFVKPVIKQERHRRQTVSHNVYRPNRHDESFLWPSLVGIGGRGEEEEEGKELDVTPEESEDELKEAMVSGGWRQATLPHSKSEEESTAEMHTFDSDLDRLHDPHLVRSYMRLESAPFVHFKQQQGAAGGKDKWHEWLSMQKDWMNNVQENPDDYFDDNL